MCCCLDMRWESRILHSSHWTNAYIVNRNSLWQIRVSLNRAENMIFLPQIPVLCRGIPVVQEEGLMTCKNIAGYLAVYRICFALAAFFFLFMLVMIKVQSSKDPRSKIQNGWDSTSVLITKTSSVTAMLVTVRHWFLSVSDCHVFTWTLPSLIAFYRTW